MKATQYRVVDVELDIGESFDFEGVTIQIVSTELSSAVIRLRVKLPEEHNCEPPIPPARQGTLKALVRDYIRINPIFTTKDLREWIMPQKPGIGSSSLEAELSYSKRQGLIRALGIGQFESLIYRNAEGLA